MKEHYLSIPLRNEDLFELEVGDVVFLSGIIYTGREGVYNQLFDKNIELPYSIASMSNVTFHCSPAIREDNGTYNISSVTATASFRFTKYMDRFLPQFNVKAVVGKSGLTAESYRRYFVPNGTIYLSTIGYGAGAIYGKSIKQVKDVVWKEELGLAQAMWVLDVEQFGPLIVESDVRGSSLFEQQNQKINQSFLPLFEEMDIPILKRIGEELNAKNEMV
ncbi:MAG: fumarate hydratase C-terminal domain-containing protein [Balneolaceae bacterium]